MKKQGSLHELVIVSLLGAVFFLQFFWVDPATGEGDGDTLDDSVAQTQARFAEDIEPHDGTTTVIITPTPTPTPTPDDQCDYYRGDVVELGDDTWRLDSYDEIFKTTGSATGLQCIEDWITKAINQCQEGHVATNTKFARKHHDDCLAWEILSYVMPDWTPVTGRWKWEQTLGEQSNGSVCDKHHGKRYTGADMGICPSGGPTGQFKYAGGCKPCGVGHFFFKQDPEDPDKCIVTRPGPEDELCGTFSLNYWVSTPISLVWSEGTELPASFSKFPLDPRNPNLWHIWRASENFPLLVHDPSHQGKIVSASQLFGPWTFGGQGYASMSSSSFSPKPWNNGFEALATMDSDGSGQIEGAELEALALWFDRNQNGSAEDGEVVSAKDAGLSQLSYGPTSKDEEGNVIVELGFKRIVDGQEKTGKAIDWISSGAPSQFDLLNKFYTSSKDRDIQAQLVENAEEVSFAASPKEQQASKPGEDTLSDHIGGVWQWAALGEESKGARGFFVLTDSANHVHGYSLLETPFTRKGSKKKQSYGTMIFLDGLKKRDKQGRLHFDFKLSGSDPKVVSEALLSDDLKTMKGQSTVSKAGGSIRYRWVATRR